jgi:hypothetical protein
LPETFDASIGGLRWQTMTMTRSWPEAVDVSATMVNLSDVPGLDRSAGPAFEPDRELARVVHAATALVEA